MSGDDPRHGTNAGYMAHRQAGQAACDACKAGRALYQRRRDYDTQLGRPRTVPSRGAQRRVRALQRLGWSLRMIANEAGWNHAEDLHYLLRNPSCNRRTWERIAETYERLSMTLPPHCSATARARNRAERLGYAPPLAWDDIDRDERPLIGGLDTDLDLVVVERILAGEWRLSSTREERTEVARRWSRNGGSTFELTRLTGWKVERYYRKGDAA